MYDSTRYKSPFNAKQYQNKFKKQGVKHLSLAQYLLCLKGGGGGGGGNNIH